MRIIDGATALHNLQSNRAAFWYNPNRPDSATLARNRVRSGFLECLIEPNFQFDSDMPVFCIGSCFARALEYALTDRGLRVLSHSHELHRLSAACGMTHYSNLYNVFTIRSVLRVALGSEPEPPDALVGIEGGAVIDLLGQPRVVFENVESALKLRTLRDSVLRQLCFARIIVLTLGMSECWYDKQNMLFLNQTPVDDAITGYPGRFAFAITDFRENLEALMDVCEILDERSGGAQIVLTVSPVALRATFGDEDVVVANLASKALLRTVVQEAVRLRPTLQYFPAFEMALLSESSLTWQADQAHVTPAFADFVVNEFLEIFAVKPIGRAQK